MFNPNIQFDIPKEHTVIGDGPASPFYLDGWLKWNEEVWALKAHRVLYTNGKSEYPRLEGVLYTDKKGRVIQPPRNSHLPFRFISTSTDKQSKLYTQYLDIMQLFVNDLNSRGLSSTISLSPGFIDARPFQWNGFTTSLRYTFMSSLPYDVENVDKKIKNKIRKSYELGYSVQITHNLEHIYECLKFTEEFKHFSHLTDINSLKLCQKYLGSESFIAHVVYSKFREPVSGGIRLVCKDGLAYGWSQGGARDHLRNGVNQLIYKNILCDVYNNKGAKYFDWGGANTPSVALAKAAWDMSLVPYLTIRQKNFRYVGSVCKEYLKNTIKNFK